MMMMMEDGDKGRFFFNNPTLDVRQTAEGLSLTLFCTRPAASLDTNTATAAFLPMKDEILHRNQCSLSTFVCHIMSLRYFYS